eukprot:g13827.t4
MVIFEEHRGQTASDFKVPGRLKAPWRRLGGEEFFSEVRSNGLRCFLQQEGGLVQVKDFLPNSLAED